MVRSSADPSPRSGARAWLVLVAALCGCSDATGTVQGGEALLVDPCAGTGGAAPHTWSALYACYFGPTGKASCSAQGICHGSATQTGSQISGFVCGTSSQECWQGMTQGMCSGGAVPPCPIVQSGQDPTRTGLYMNLRKSDGTGNMPLNSGFTFTADDMARISAWIQEGAQNN
jgi:hypothetical protein